MYANTLQTERPKMSKQMPLGEVLEKVREGCSRYMYLIDEQGRCAESDEYVVALSFFDDYMEKIKSEEEKEAMREAEWNRDTYDHIEEKQRDYSLGEQETQIRNGHAHKE